MSHNIAIDGPAGAGKSTIAKKVAQKLNYIYVDTGAMYRAMALFLLRQGIRPDETEKIDVTCEKADITIRYENGEQVVLLNGENVNGLIRTEGEAAAGIGCKGKCGYGRQGHWHLCAAECSGESLSDGRCVGAGKAAF